MRRKVGLQGQKNKGTREHGESGGLCTSIRSQICRSVVAGNLSHFLPLMACA